MSEHTINISFDAKCAECGKPGACDNGLCMRCISKSMNPAARMKSDTGRAVQDRWERILAKSGRAT